METNNSEKSSLSNTVVVVQDKKMKAELVNHEDQVTSMEINKGGHSEPEKPDNSSKPLYSSGEDRASIKHKQKDDDDELQSAKAEMGEVREENERLKLLLARIVRDYQSLQLHFADILRKEEESKKSMDINCEEVDELVSLSLGRSSSSPSDQLKNSTNLITISRKDDADDDDGGLDGAGLSLELGCRFEPTDCVMKNSILDNYSSGDLKEDDPIEVWPPSKTLKTTRSGEDEVAQQSHLKKARVSIRARCDAPTMHDGCQWRKYGQKIAKGNPCPRAYYRCTVSPSCPVRKQVQRCAEDMSILITTYEGSHNHPLPMSATAMASTTSAAASMLQSHSTTSQQGLINSTTTAPISASTNLFNASTNFSQNSRLQPQQQFYYFPNSSISTNNSHPTITLDLTTPSPSQFGQFPSNPRYPSTCLNFSSSPYNNTSDLPSYFNYGTMVQSQNKLHQIGSSLHNFGKQPIFQDLNLYQSYMKNQIKAPPCQQQQLLTDTIATATKSITSDPKFQSALAAALTSFVGNGVRESHQSGSSTTESTTTTSGVKLKWGETSLASNASLSGIGCASSSLNKSS